MTVVKTTTSLATSTTWRKMIWKRRSSSRTRRRCPVAAAMVPPSSLPATTTSSTRGSLLPLPLPQRHPPPQHRHPQAPMRHPSQLQRPTLPHPHAWRQQLQWEPGSSRMQSRWPMIRRSAACQTPYRPALVGTCRRQLPRAAIWSAWTPAGRPAPPPHAAAGWGAATKTA